VITYTIRLFTLFAFILTGLLAGSSFAQPPDFVQLAEQLKPSVVNISTAQTVKPRTPAFPRPGSPGNDMFEEFFEKFFRGHPQTPRKKRALGSGFIISKDGYILTNGHVVEDADVIKVKLSDGDLALIKIEAGEGLPVAELGDSDSLKVGEWVMAIGNPFGLEQTVTVGIVSAKGRVNMAKQIIPQLRDDGHVTRGYLGVTVQPLTEELAESFGMDEPKGALVNEVIEGSPAEEAGLKRGDIILSCRKHSRGREGQGQNFPQGQGTGSQGEGGTA
jgi:serine protease Do